MPEGEDGRDHREKGRKGGVWRISLRPVRKLVSKAGCAANQPICGARAWGETEIYSASTIAMLAIGVTKLRHSVMGLSKTVTEGRVQLCVGGQ